MQIAEKLAAGEDYAAIREEFKVNYSTIARVNTWLNLAGEGFELMLSRRKKSPSPVADEERYDPYICRPKTPDFQSGEVYSPQNIKRCYSSLFSEN